MLKAYLNAGNLQPMAIAEEALIWPLREREASGWSQDGE